MHAFIFILFLVMYTVHADFDEKNSKHVTKNSFSSMKFTWEALKEEAELRKKRKFGLGNSSGKDGSHKSNTRRLSPVKVSMLEDKIRLSYEPVAYTPERNTNFLPGDEKMRRMSELRYRDYITHQPLKPIYLSDSSQ